MNKIVLLIEDSKEIFQVVNTSLNSLCEVKWAENIEQAKKQLEDTTFDLILLDIELPDGNGVEFCANLHAKNPLLPIFLLTAHDDLSDKVLGFSAGADDYITKPFNSLELKARVEAKFKKLDLMDENSEIMKWKELEINTSSQIVTLHPQGPESTEPQNIELTALEYKLFMLFANNVNTVLEREKILDDIWGKDIHVYSRSVDTHISKLRKKLGPCSELIESVHGVGYKFNPTTL